MTWNNVALESVRVTVFDLDDDGEDGRATTRSPCERIHNQGAADAQALEGLIDGEATD